jgi:hypothetical protein
MSRLLKEEKEMTEKIDIPNPVSFLLHTPLYEEFKWEKEQIWDVIALKYFKGALDCYCPECGRESTFRGITEQAPPAHVRDRQLESKRRAIGASTSLPSLQPGVFEVTLHCTRNTGHLHNYLFLIKNKLKESLIN